MNDCWLKGMANFFQDNRLPCLNSECWVAFCRALVTCGNYVCQGHEAEKAVMSKKANAFIKHQESNNVALKPNPATDDWQEMKLCI